MFVWMLAMLAITYRIYQFFRLINGFNVFLRFFDIEFYELLYKIELLSKLHCVSHQCNDRINSNIANHRLSTNKFSAIKFNYKLN